jgi:hypothetical protein
MSPQGMVSGGGGERKAERRRLARVSPRGGKDRKGGGRGAEGFSAWQTRGTAWTSSATQVLLHERPSSD